MVNGFHYYFPTILSQVLVVMCKGLKAKLNLLHIKIGLIS